MSSPIDKYKAEHRRIARVIDAFETYLLGLSDDAGFDQQEFTRFVHYFREYGDLVHHEKEESILLPAMVRSGCSWDDGPVEIVRQQHNQERYLTRSLVHAALQKDAWSREARRRVVSTGASFVEFMRNHMRLEEEQLFPRAESCLSEEAAKTIEERFDRFDAEWGAGGELEWLEQLGDDLVARHPAATS